jgi:hypothetical protein
MCHIKKEHMDGVQKRFLMPVNMVRIISNSLPFISLTLISHLRLLSHWESYSLSITSLTLISHLHLLSHLESFILFHLLTNTWQDLGSLATHFSKVTPSLRVLIVGMQFMRLMFRIKMEVSSQRRWVVWNGVKWSEMEWNGVKWSEVEWSGVKWSEMEWNGVKWCEVDGGLMH